MRKGSRILGAALLVLGAITILIWVAVLQADRHGKLTVSFLDTGTGSAIFILAPSGRTVLLDGGPDAGILRSLGPELPWWQRHIDVIIAAHPDQAHATGLIDILERYDVGQVFVSSNAGSGPVMEIFQKTLAEAQKKGNYCANGRAWAGH